MKAHQATVGIERRPWPTPKRPWILRMRWEDLAFLHWPVDAALLRPRVPGRLAIDTFEGRAWIGVVPFRMSGVRARLTPPIPGLSAFPELNVRTYVSADGKPGVWFFSLDAQSPLAVHAARTLVFLPYFHARMRVHTEGDLVRYASRRTHRGAPEAEFVASYRPTGPVAHTVPGSLDAWLTDRYCLYSADRRGRVFRLDVLHEPWPLQPAEVRIERDTTTAALGLARDGPPLAHFARSLDVVAWNPERVV